MNRPHALQRGGHSCFDAEKKWKSGDSVDPHQFNMSIGHCSICPLLVLRRPGPLGKTASGIGYS